LNLCDAAERKLKNGGGGVRSCSGRVAVLERLHAGGSFLHVSDFSINLYGKYLCYAILAISVDLLWGYTGLLSLGQASFSPSAAT
jgi:ABC-type branched-subunit amino acid transport system permease subunit